ncbi:MAG: cytochrome C, partial [Candidatus Schekmanbacteria bacterium RBG_13_48_7]
MKLELPRSTHNWITIIGATIALITLFMIVFLFTITLFWAEGSTYIGVVIYILLPAVLIMGLLLIPVGMLFQNWQAGKLKKFESLPWPKIDLNDRKHRNAFFIFSIGTTFLLFISSIGSYETFHFTESVRFCGTLCHQVMNPEYTAYRHSPHARVACVSCHVGPGAGWYVRSKLAGAYQVYATLFNIYPRPIPTPVKNLRPARETCEACHWPEKFYSQKLLLETHYLPDEENTRWDIYLILKIGALHSAGGLQEGIHWHINPDVRIEYIADNEERENLPWVRYTNLKTGNTIVYQDQDSPITQSEIQTKKIRVLDCIDCHNRPSHNYRPPAIFVNEAITAGNISRELPEIKYISMEILSEEFTSHDAAMKGIQQKLFKFYEDKYPDIYKSKRELINSSSTELQKVFSENIFPNMKVRWSAYPNHIGHLEFNGCFRCHNGSHKSSDDK